MSETTNRMNYTYPSRDQDPWYEDFQSLVNAIDSSTFAHREDRSLVFAGGGTLSWTAGTSTLTWTDTIRVASTISGRQITISANSTVLNDGQILYLELTRQPLQNISTSFLTANQLPSSNNACAVAVRLGDVVFFRTGISLSDGTTSPGISPVPSSGGGPGSDTTAVHVDVAGEIAGVAPKATPTVADYLLIENAAAANAKARITLGDIPSGPPAAHVSTHEPGGSDALTVDAAGATGSLRTLGTGAQQACAGNDSRLSDARTPTAHNTSHQSGGADAIKLDDLAATDDNTNLDSTVSAHGLLPKLGGGTTNFLRADGTWAAPPGGTDANAIHDNVAGEIALITEKVTPVSADLLILEDSADSNNKKRVQVGNLPGGSGTDPNAIHDNVAGEIVAVTEKTTPVSADVVLIEDSEDSNNKKRVQIGNISGGSAIAAENTSYRELVSNALDTQGVSVVENDTGEGVFNAGLHQSIVFRATLTASWASTGTLTVSLYDDGPTTAPGTPRLVTSFAKTANGGYEVFEQSLTIVASGASTNEVLGNARVYRVTIEVDGTTGDTGYIGSAGFVATGTAETLSADQIQAIVMSLNA